MDCEVKSATFFVSKTYANPYHLDEHPDAFCEKVFFGLKSEVIRLKTYKFYLLKLYMNT